MLTRAATILLLSNLMVATAAHADESCADDGLDALVARAQAATRARNYQDALTLYDEARSRWAGCEKHPLGWQIWFGYADAKLVLGMADDAKALLPVVEELALGDFFRLSKTARFGAAIHHRAGDLDSAEEYAKRAIDFARQGGHIDREVDARSMLATVYSLSGRNQESLAVNETLVALEREHDLKSLLAKSLNNIGIDYRHFGRYVEAVTALDESLDLYRELGNPIGQARALYNKANVYSETGDFERARDLKLESLALTETVGDTYGLALLHSDLAELFLVAGNLEAAERHAATSLSINESAKQAYGLLNALAALGTIERRRQNWDIAASTSRRGMTLADESGYRRLAAVHRIGLAFAEIGLGDGEAALELATEAETIALALEDVEVLIDALEAKARAYETLNRSADATSVYLDAIELLESWRGRLALGDLRVGLAERRWGVFEGAIRTLVAQGRNAESFDVAERARARLLLELMSERFRRQQDKSDAISELEIRLKERWRAFKRASDEVKPEVAREIEALKQSLDAALASRRQHDPVDAMLRYPQPLSVDELRASLLKPGRGLLAYFWGEQHVYAWLVDDADVAAVRVGEAGELETLTEFLETAIDQSDGEVDWRIAATRTHALLLEPLLTTELDELVAIVDGPLARVPLEALLPSGADFPLGAQTQVFYGPSASVFAALNERTPPENAARGMLTVGYSPDDGQPPLPFALREARYIGELFEDEGATLLMGSRATVDNWLAAGPGHHRVLHFASHAVVDDTRPEATKLILSGAPLGLGTIRDLDLHADLVTLSACETALGRRVRGEGIVGLTHAFLAAGARSLIVTTRRVEDRVAARFMRRFYAHYQESRAIQGALFATRREMILDRAEPFEWAGFVLVGGLP